MKFIQFSDTHLHRNYENVEYMQQLAAPIENLKRTLQIIDWQEISFVVFTGDLIHEGEQADYEMLKEAVSEYVPAQVEVLYALGNHDRKAPFYQVFMGIESEAPYYYEKETEGYRLLVLDSAIPGKESGCLTDEQLQWLREVLQKPSPKGSLVFLHHPVIGEEGAPFDAVIKNSKEVAEILKSGDVIAVFCGHTHQNAATAAQGLSQYTSDSMAFSIDSDAENIYFNDQTGYIRGTVKDSSIIVNYINAGTANNAAVFPKRLLAEMLNRMDGE